MSYMHSRLMNMYTILRYMEDRIKKLSLNIFIKETHKMHEK